MASESGKAMAPPTLTGDKVYLRPTTAEDIPSLHSWSLACDPQSMTCHPRMHWTTAERIDNLKQAKKTEKEQGFVICRIKDGRPVGIVRYFGLNTLNRSAELGLMVDPDEHRKGYGTEGMKVLIRYLFRYRGLNKVHAQTSSFNPATVGLLEKLGFKRDAVLRDHYFYDGAFHPGYIYSLLLYELDF